MGFGVGWEIPDVNADGSSLSLSEKVMIKGFGFCRGFLVHFLDSLFLEHVGLVLPAVVELDDYL